MFWNSKCDALDVIVDQAIQWWKSFVSVNEVKTLLLSCHSQAKWCLSPSGRLKLIIDGSWNNDKNLGGFGVSNYSRDFVAAKCGNFSDVFSPL